MELIPDHIYSYYGDLCIYEYYTNNEYHFHKISKPNSYYTLRSVSIGFYSFLQYIGPKSDYPELFI